MWCGRPLEATPLAARLEELIMNALRQSFLMSLLGATVLGLCACSDHDSAEKVGQKIDKATESAKETLADSSDAVRHEAAKAGAVINDVALAAKVKAEIRKDSALKASDISVDSENGVVVLSGMVERPEDAIRAVQIARAVDDVKSVESKLSVRSNG
jgi:hyperosmotically inducible protein